MDAVIFQPKKEAHSMLETADFRADVAYWRFDLKTRRLLRNTKGRIVSAGRKLPKCAD